MRTLVIQSYRTHNVPRWIDRCLESVRHWAALKGFDYRFADDSSFALCGEAYLASVGDNKCSITNLSRLELLKLAFADGYERAIWLDADVQVFDPDLFAIDLQDGYAFARETWVSWSESGRWIVESTVNNSLVVFTRDQPDLDFLITATRHVGVHRRIKHNFQVGMSLVRSLWASLDFDVVENSGMFSSSVLYALVRNLDLPLEAQARYHGARVYAANLCGASHSAPAIDEANILAAMDRLEPSRGDAVNRLLDERGALYAAPYPAENPFNGPDLGL